MPTFGFGTNEPDISPGGDRIGGFAQKVKDLFSDLYNKLNSCTWSNATQDASGYMSADDKKKLDCIYYGTCSTEAATDAKLVSCTNFVLATGARLIVKFTVTNTAANPTLNVNSTGAKAIQYRGAAISAGYLAANRTYEFVYDGSYWQLVGDINTDTHWTSHLFAGASDGSANAATTNGNTYLIICDNSTARDRRKIAGSGATSVTSDASGNITITSSNTTYSNFVKSGSTAAAGLVPSPGTTAGTTRYLREDATWQVPPDNNTVYTHPTTSGNKHLPSGGSSGQFCKWSSDGTGTWAADNNTTYGNFVKSGSSAAAGLVPKPSTTAGTTKYLREDATWVAPPNTTYGNFVKSGSTAAAGLVPSPGTTAGTTKYLREDATWQVPPDTNTVYSHPTSSGNKHLPSGGSSGQIVRWSSDGTGAWGTDSNTTYSTFVKSGSSAAAGLVPKPSTTAGTTKYLREDATWQVPPDNNTTYSTFVKSGSTAAAGLVPKPSTTAGTTKYLREDASWQVPPNTNTTYTAGNGMELSSTKFRNKIVYATCATAAVTQAKVASVTAGTFELIAGALVMMKFTKGQDVQTTGCSININSTGAKTMTGHLTTLSENCWVILYYDGTTYHSMGYGD